MKDLIDKYRMVLNTNPKKREGDELSPEHLSWMLCEMSSMVCGSSKFCRWFGFVHYAMLELNLISISPQNPFLNIDIRQNQHEKRISTKPIKALISRYAEIAHSHNDGKKTHTKINIVDIYNTLANMINMDFNEPTFHLYLGFIQCAMLSNGLIAVKEERELTREIF